MQNIRLLDIGSSNAKRLRIQRESRGDGTKEVRLSGLLERHALGSRQALRLVAFIWWGSGRFYGMLITPIIVIPIFNNVLHRFERAKLRRERAKYHAASRNDQ